LLHAALHHPELDEPHEREAKMTNEASGATTPHAPPPAGTLAVYRGATLFDGTGRAPRPSTSIVMDGASIRAVGDDAEIAASLPAEARVHDLDGRFVMPGLIDSHQHIATPPDRPAAEAVLDRLVHSGVTAIRDMADAGEIVFKAEEEETEDA
jgi:predicted amidohydrolase YtcJ